MFVAGNVERQYPVIGLQSQAFRELCNKKLDNFQPIILHMACMMQGQPATVVYGRDSIGVPLNKKPNQVESIISATSQMQWELSVIGSSLNAFRVTFNQKLGRFYPMRMLESAQVAQWVVAMKMR